MSIVGPFRFGTCTILLCGAVLTPLTGSAEEQKHPEIVSHEGVGFSRIDPDSKMLIAYDPVAAFDEHATRVGDCAQFKTSFRGVRWCFATVENMNKFSEAAKERVNHYVPFGGGYCARGLSNGNLAEGDPRTHVRAGDDLVVNGSWEVADEFWNEPERRAAARIFYKVALRTGLIIPNGEASK